MYWFSYQPLKERLKNRLISDREALPYLLMFVALETLAVSVPDKSTMNKWDIIEMILFVVSSVGGMIYVYKKNGGSTGYDIIQKYVILGWVVIVRFFIFILPLGAVIYAVAYYAGLIGEETTFFNVPISIGLYLIYYERLGKHIADTNGNTGEQIAQPDSQ